MPIQPYSVKKHMNQELAPLPKNQPASQSEAVHLGETLSKSPRVVIFGSRISGAFNLVRAINAELEEKGVHGVDVYGSRNVANIEGSFFGRGTFAYDKDAAASSEQPALPASPPEMAPKTGLLQRLGDKLLRRTTEVALVAEAPAIPPQPQDRPDTVPLGVIVFPEMRQYYTGGMTIPTPYEAIDALAETYGVPVVHVDKIETHAELGQAMDQLHPQALLELPPAPQA
jgi:hypothetical protein